MSIFSQVIGQYRRWKIPVATKNIIYHWKNRELKKSFGNENPDKVFYVIRPVNDKSRFYTGPILNLFANYFYVVSHLFYAEQMGWIPVVDQLNYPVYNSVDEMINGTHNAWEYFFEQPSDYSLDEVYRSKNVVLSKRSWFGEHDMGYEISNYTNSEVLAEYKKMCDRIKLNAPTRQYSENVMKSLFPENSRILGVSYRYGGHSKACCEHANGHPIQPGNSELVSLARQRFSEWRMDYVFLSSDESTIVDDFRSEFGDRLLVLPRIRRKSGQLFDSSSPNPMYTESNLYGTTLEYISEVVLISKCNAIISSVTSGIRFSIVANCGNYEFCEILDKGRFEDKRKRKG